MNMAAASQQQQTVSVPVDNIRTLPLHSSIERGDVLPSGQSDRRIGQWAVLRRLRLQERIQQLEVALEVTTTGDH